MDAKQISVAVKEYRLDSGLTQEKLAEKSGLSKKDIRQIELAKQVPTTKVLMQIAKALEIKFLDLIQTHEKLVNVRFRANKTLKNRNTILGTVSGWIQDYEFLEDALNCRQHFKLENTFRGQSPEQLARDIREELEIHPDAPIEDMGILLDQIGVKLLLYRKTRAVGFDGLSLLDKHRNPAIVINASEAITSERQIFSAAHELGHVLMHMDSFHEDEDEEKAEREEKEANAFAGHFLMPTSSFEEIWKQTSGKHWVDRVLYTKAHFRVSCAVVLHRFDELYGTKSVARFYAEFNKKKGKRLTGKDEPMPLRWNFEETRFSRLVCEALEKDEISVSRAAQMLGITIPELYQILDSTPSQK